MNQSIIDIQEWQLYDQKHVNEDDTIIAMPMCCYLGIFINT